MAKATNAGDPGDNPTQLRSMQCGVLCGAHVWAEMADGAATAHDYTQVTSPDQQRSSALSTA
jgi:hypothetical protein